MSVGDRTLAVAAAVIAAASLAACGGDDKDSDQLFDREGFGFTFEYPADFEETDAVTTDASLGGEADVSAGVALEEEDGIFAEQYTLNRAVDESGLGSAQAELDRLLRSVTNGASAEQTEVAGLPALVYDEVEVQTIEGGQSRLNFIFDGDQEYLINCQSTADGRDQVDEACDLALKTFALK